MSELSKIDPKRAFTELSERYAKLKANHQKNQQKLNQVIFNIIRNKKK